MVCPLPLPFLDYHPLLQPVTKSTRKKFLPKWRIFWALVVIQLASSVVFFLDTPEIRFEAMFIPVPPVWAVLSTRSMIPMQFFVLFFLGMPMNVCIGVSFISKLQKPSFGFAPSSALREILTAPAVSGWGKLRPIKFRNISTKHGEANAADGFLTTKKGIEPQGIAAVLKQQELEQYLNDYEQELELSSTDDFKQPKKVNVDSVMSRIGASWSRLADYLTETQKITQKEAFLRLEAARLAGVSHRSFEELTTGEKVHLFNLLLYSFSGCCYCFVAWHLYRKLADAVTEELRDPVQPLISEPRDGLSAEGECRRANELLSENPIFSPPRSILQEPPALWPFVGVGRRLGSDASPRAH